MPKIIKKKPIQILYKIYRETGDLKTIVQLVDKDFEDSGCLLPIWCIYCSLLWCFFIFAALIAAVFTVYFAQRPGLYQESCATRSCVKDLNLKCINNTCLCTTDEIYVKRCIPIRDYMQSCSTSYVCYSSKYLSCLDGVCKCDDDKYWSGLQCLQKLSYNKSCTNDNQCFTQTFMYCDKNSSACLCSKTRFWDGTSCFPKKTLNENCLSTSQCREWEYLSCVSGKCQCTSNEYWSSTTFMCREKLVENDTCSLSNQCYSPMNCSNNSLCQCGSYQYHNITTLTCNPQRNYSESCLVDYNCRVDKYLECNNGECKCISSFPVWSYGYGKCIIPSSYTEPCFDTTDCDSSKALVCYDGTYNCSCPVNITTSLCDCVRSFNNEYYWNQFSCVAAKGYNQSCLNSASTYMCKTITEGTICSGPSPYRCKCPTYQYYHYTNKKCQSQIATPSTSCSQTDACRSDLGLSCQVGMCECNGATQFWNGSICINYYSYNEGTCLNDIQCKGTLVCKTSGSTSCSCSLNINDGKCDCPARIFGSEYYWNGTDCVLAASFNETCYNRNYTCQTITGNLYCDSSTGLCKCPSNTFWNSTHCVSCLTGWYYLRGSCFRGSLPNTINDYNLLSTNDIQTLCYGLTNVKVASLINSDLLANIFSKANGFSQKEYFIQNYRISGTNVFKSTDGLNVTYDTITWSGSPTGHDCLIISPTTTTAFFEIHDCTHGHEVLCEYKF